MTARTIALMIAIPLMGILLGGIVYSHIVFFPVYLSALPDSAVLVNGPYALHEERFWLLIHPLAILSLITSLALNWKIRARRKTHYHSTRRLSARGGRDEFVLCS
jgi:hypothetical protein